MSTGKSEVICGKLISYLRTSYSDKSLEYNHKPELVLGGYESSVFKFKLNTTKEELKGYLLLKINHESYDIDKFDYDIVIQRLLFEAGMPVARILVACNDKDILGGLFVVMNYIEGEVMWNMAKALIPRMLAYSHLSIHEYNTDTIVEKLIEKEFMEKCIFSPISSALHDLKQMDVCVVEIEKWLYDNRPITNQLSICHGDYHPNNILVVKNQIVGILDWHFALGHPEQDIALTMKILNINSKVHVDESEWPYLDDFVELYLRAYQEKSDINFEYLDYFYLVHCLRDLGEGQKKGGLYRTHPYRVSKQLEAVERISGIKLQL